MEAKQKIYKLRLTDTPPEGAAPTAAPAEVEKKPEPVAAAPPPPPMAPPPAETSGMYIHTYSVMSL